MIKPVASIALTGLAAALLFSWGCSRSAKVDLKAANSRPKAPDFTLKDANGQSVHFADYKGKVVLLDFWATWCGPCKVEIPWFMDFEQKYKDRGFSVIGVSMDEDGWKVVKPYMEQAKMNYRVLLGNDAISQLYGGLDNLPTTFLIDRSGRIAKVHVGIATDKDGFQNEIQNLLETPRNVRLLDISPVPAWLTSAN